MSIYQGFLIGKSIRATEFVPSELNDHEHCIMCWVKFSSAPKDLRVGFSTEDGLNWICPECFKQYKDEYKWTIIK